jgi:hypothetical protein
LSASSGWQQIWTSIKGDLKRYSDFVNQKTYDLLIRGKAAAKANDRDIVDPCDLPITKGLQERIHEFVRRSPGEP